MTPMGIMWPKYRRAPLESNHNLGNIAEPMGKPSLQKNSYQSSDKMFRLDLSPEIIGRS